MKYCPKCSQNYSDDSLNFCLADGTALIFLTNNSEETIVMGSAVTPRFSQPPRQGMNPFFAYLAIGLLALIAGGAIVALLMSRSESPSKISTQQPNISSANTPNNIISNAGNIREPAINRKEEVVQYPDSKPQPLTTESVQNLLSTWENAQNGKNFATYQACYDSSFIGVKATKSGHSQTYGYGAWMADRRKMIAVAINLNVSHSNMQIRMEEDTAVARFDQYYRSLRYSDWGPKEITVKMTPAGPKIVREELKASYPL